MEEFKYYAIATFKNVRVYVVTFIVTFVMVQIWPQILRTHPNFKNIFQLLRDML